MPGRFRSIPCAPIFDQSSTQRRGTSFKVCRRLGEVGVTDDDVQSAYLSGVSVRFVAGVDDCRLSVVSSPTSTLDVIGALSGAKLEAGSSPEGPMTTRPEP